MKEGQEGYSSPQFQPELCSLISQDGHKHVHGSLLLQEAAINSAMKSMK